MNWIIFLGILVFFVLLVIKWIEGRHPPAIVPPSSSSPRKSKNKKHKDVRNLPQSQPILVAFKKNKNLKGIELNEDFQKALELIEKQGRSSFITGKAGTGKSTLLKYFRATTSKTAVVLAPTGLAAINVSGQTIHSFFKFPPKFINRDKIFKSRNFELFQKLDTIIVDEVSMVRADLMDGIDASLRLNRTNSKIPFGGVQLVFFGDLFQLPPIIKERELKEFFNNYYGGPYFFYAKAFEGMQLPYVDLHKNYRQQDDRFRVLLNNIREKKIDDFTLKSLNSRVQSAEEFHKLGSYITLTTTNEAAFQKNSSFLEKIKGKNHQYKATVAGKFDPSSFPTEEVLDLKNGAQVMMMKNDPDKKWVNGTLCTISDLQKEKIYVEIAGDSYEVPKETWQNIEYQYNREMDQIEERIVGTFQQYPLRLAWAITIHKSQGQTFDKVFIDLGRGAFAHGQTYVALSRCRSLEGIGLDRPINLNDIIFDEKVCDFKKVFTPY